MKHDLYKDGDKDIPPQILDRNGEVVLALCKVCGQAEGDLEESCNPPTEAWKMYDLARAKMAAELLVERDENKRLRDQLKLEKQEPVAWLSDGCVTITKAKAMQWRRNGYTVRGLYTTPPTCPECEKLKAERDALLRAVDTDYEQLYRETLAERDNLKSMSATEACATIPAIGEYVAQLEHQRDELAAQVEKMREALNTWKLAEQHALSYGHLEPEAGCADAYDHATRERNEALALPDLSTGILNTVRAESLSNAANWFRTMRPFEDGSFDVQPGCHSEIAAVLIDRLAKQAADMEAGEC